MKRKVQILMSAMHLHHRKRCDSQVEWEALSLKWACKLFKSYVTGAKFKIVIHNDTIVTIFDKPSHTRPPRIEKWILSFRSHDFTVDYRLVRDSPSDYSSQHLPENNDEEMTLSQTTETQLIFIMNSSIHYKMLIGKLNSIQFYKNNFSSSVG